MNARSIRKHERRARRNAILGGMILFVLGLGMFWTINDEPTRYRSGRTGTFSLGVKSESVSAESSTPFFSDTSWGSSSGNSLHSTSVPEPTSLLLMMPAALMLLRRTRRS